jgi:hypothetical protein
MKRPALIAVALTAVTLLNVRAEPTPFVDVPDCHWASQAINISVDRSVATPAKTALTAQNALRQVFEGMQCGSADWVSRFVDAAPSGLAGIASQRVVRGFNLTFTKVVVNGAKASVGFNIALTYTQNGGAVTVKRSGTANLVANDETAWKVAYASLAGLNLPIFPK